MHMSHNVFNLVYNESELHNIKHFYAEILLAWDSVSKHECFSSLDLNETLSQPLFQNLLINYKGTLLCFIKFIESEIIHVACFSNCWKLLQINIQTRLEETLFHFLYNYESASRGMEKINLIPN